MAAAVSEVLRDSEARGGFTLVFAALLFEPFARLVAAFAVPRAG
jgi:hypothetical protein